MEKLRMQSANGVEDNIQKIAQLFPDCVTETMDEVSGQPKHLIDFEKLKQNLSDSVMSEKAERYQFTWPDKSKAILLANSPIKATLRPCREESVDFDNTQNLYIEGDNLDVLKCLKETYLHKVKMIYIDPPYNTGNDFVYEDDFAQSSEEYLANSGQYDEQGNRMFTNAESNGRFHTDWLNMIYPRLKVARDLLTDDGVIFISIDDTEVDNIRKICDEIFGYQNRLDRGSMVWVNRGSTKGFSKLVKNHEFILAYGKKEELVQSHYGLNNPEELESLEHYCYNKPSPKNPTTDVVFEKGTKIEGQKDITFKDHVGDEVQLEILEGIMTFKNGTLQDTVTLRGSFPYCTQIANYYKNKKIGKDTFDNKGQKWVEIYFNSKGLPRYRKERNTKIISSVIDEKGIPNYGSEDIAKLFGKKEIFNFPKPKELVYHLLNYFTKNEDLILDFFSGSGTTAHAIMNLNLKTSGNRKFIMVQLPELTYTGKTEKYMDGNEEKERYVIDDATGYPVVLKDTEARKAGYYTIPEIGKERIRRAGKKIKEESPLTTQDLDTGFRVLKLDSTNMEDIYYSPKDVSQATLFSQVDNVKPDRTGEDLLFQVMLELGATLDSKIETTTVAGKTIYNVADNYLVACFDRDVSDEVVKAIAKAQPIYAVLRDTSMKNDATATNFEQIFKTYSPETVTKIL